MYTTVAQCRICGNTELDTVLDLGRQALTGIFPKERDAAVPVAPLELAKCREDGSDRTCGLVQLRHSVQADAMYGANYGYRSGLNQSMVEHLRGKARKIANMAALKGGDLVLDIGSNDSTLLRAFETPGLRRVGFDPTGIKFQQYYPPDVQLVPDFFSAGRFRQEFGGASAKVVTSIAMFYDLEAPLEFARQVHEILAEDGIWVFEQSYLPSMVATNSYDTICHEHLEYYGLKQILWILERAGFSALEVEFNNVNGGSFSVTAGRQSAVFPQHAASIAELVRHEEENGYRGMTVYREFRDRTLRHREELVCFLSRCRTNGEKIAGYGASTKGNVILQFCGITPEMVPCIAEVNPDKFGAFTPGSRIPIVSEPEAKAMGPSGFLVLPWHFRDNILAREERYLREGGKFIFPLPRIEVVQV